jgi:uncharacterized surface protein with fasciclin (FAS1) repeats
LRHYKKVAMEKTKLHFKNPVALVILAIMSFIFISVLQACHKDGFSYQEPVRQVLAYDMLKEDTSLSIAVEALAKAKLDASLNTYGPFTFFIPDNNAFRKYFVSKGKTGLKDFTEQELKNILVYHILPSRLKSADFIQGPQAIATGQGDVISLDISKGFKFNTIANSIATVYQTDLEFSNALVHKIDAVLNPPTSTIGEFLEQNKDKYSIMIAGFKRAQLWDTINNLTDAFGTRIRITLFAEPDEVLKAASIDMAKINSMPLDQLDTLMRYHLIAGAGFSASYTKKTDAIPRAGLIERWDSTIITLNREQWLYFDLAAAKLVNSIANFSASDVIMRNGVLHVLDKHIEFSNQVKRTPIFWYIAASPNTNFAYGLPGIPSTQGPAILGSGRWRTFGPEGSPGRNFLFFDPDGVNDSLIVVVPGIRKGKYRIEVSYKAGASRGDYQLVHEQDNIGVPTFLGLKVGSTDYDQKLYLGDYVFKNSGSRRLNFTTTRVGGFAIDNVVLKPLDQ